MTTPRIWMRGVARTRTPSLYQLSAMPGRALVSHRSFNTLPGSNRRCSEVSSLRSSRTSGTKKSSVLLPSPHGTDCRLFQANLSSMTFTSSTHYLPSLHTRTMTLPWRPGGLTTLPSSTHSLLFIFCSSVDYCGTESDLAKTEKLPPFFTHSKTKRKNLKLMNMLQLDSGRRVNLRGGEGSLEM